MRGSDTLTAQRREPRQQVRPWFDWKRFLRGEGPQPAPVRLHQRKVYILPTRRGLIFALLLLVMLIGSINYNNSLAYLLTFFLASIGIVSMLHTYRNLIGLSLSCGPVAAVFAQQAPRLPVVVENSDRVGRCALELRVIGGSTVRCDVGVSERAEVELTLPGTARGRFELPYFTISSRYPLGLFRAWSPVHLRGRYIVYPRPAANARLPLEQVLSQPGTGDQGRGADDFAGLRSYRPGDSLRHVHWKAAARGQDLLTKQFGGDSNEELWLDWEQAAGHDVEQRLSVLARWVLDADQLGLDYGLRLPGQRVALGRGSEQRGRCLTQLAVFEIER